MNTKTNNRPSRSSSTRNKRKPFSHSNTSKRIDKGGKFKSGRPSNKRAGGKFTKTSSDSKNSRGNNRPKRGGNRGGGGGGRKQPTFNPSQFINRNPVEVKQEVYTPKNTFKTFGLPEKLVQKITGLKMTIPTPIQDQIIPEILKGRDVIGLAETGTGKTAAFLIPLIDRTLKDMDMQTLILTPTRELAIQINEEMRSLTKGFNIFSTICVGGMNINPQIRSLRRTNQFVIGTPGRVIDLLNRKCFLPNKVRTVVLDEADRMLDMGFIGDMRKILSFVPKQRETLLFSATMDASTKKIVHEFLNNPVEISVKKKDVTNSIKQDVVEYTAHNKYDTLLSLLKKPEAARVIIFGSMKHSVEKLSRQLTKDGIKAESIHGNKVHGQRQRSLQAFKSGQAQVLVATDVAARGIHVDNVSHVINYDLPTSFEDYVHRIGRTGRAEKRGIALTFVAVRAPKDRF